MQKQHLIFITATIIAFITVSTGFDFYAHAVSYYFYDIPINSGYLLFDSIVLPRYLALSYIYEFSSRLGIPLGLTCLVLILIPAISIFKTIHIRSGKCYVLADVFVIGAVLILAFYYSGLSIFILWLIAFIRTKKSIFIFGCFFHPVGLILGAGLLLIVNQKAFIKLLLLAVILFTMVYFFTEYQVFTVNNRSELKYKISFDTFEKLFLVAIEKKSNETFIILFLMLMLLFKSNSISKFLIPKLNIFNAIFIKKGLLNIGLTLCLIFVIIYMAQKDTLISSIVRFNMSNPIYIAWFDWGAKDLNIRHYELYGERY